MEERRGGQGRAARPSPLVRIGQGEGGGAPLSFLPSTSSPLPLLVQHGKKGGVLLPVGVGLLLARLSPWPAEPPLAPLYTGAGAPLNTQLIIDLLAVCGAPSTIVHLDNTVAVLRRSPASVEHQHHHHDVMLTKLSLNPRLDRSSRDVIKLNVC